MGRKNTPPHSVCGNGVSKQLFCIPGQVQWKIGNGSILPVTSLGVAQGVLRVAAGDIVIERMDPFKDGNFIFLQLQR